MEKETNNVDRRCPLLITIEDREIGIEYKDGKYILVGDESDMDEGVKKLLLTMIEAIKNSEDYQKAVNGESVTI